jgi:carnitine O-acetyltransferase
LKRRTKDLKHYLAEAATETKEMMERAAKAETAKKDSEGGKAKL